MWPSQVDTKNWPAQPLFFFFSFNYSEKIDKFLYEKEYKILIKKNEINIVNYDEIIDFSLTKISLKYNGKLIIIEGKNLIISKMVDNEVLITGNITNISIN